jgi:hypothetical protein
MAPVAELSGDRRYTACRHVIQRGALHARMITRGIREFVSRDWRLVRRAKDRYWADRIQQLGAVEGLRVADELRRQALALDPLWPHPEGRQADLSAHVRLAQLFSRVSSPRRR